MKPQKWTLEQIQQAVAEQLKIESNEIQDDDNLLLLGLDSVSLMTLVGQWRDAGANIEFQDLIEEPTLRDWLQRLND
ncbi:hypothetical protein GCM10023206_08570 [Acinetobacter puyangensis]|uniref:Bifunctional isochorismate lyase / aryl carrier protein n=1 Tax=Acinetobacter puyangensis TaxID=1096779 RepID=A0A240ECV8_9GAMM|nr:phosphopantetheine-binding protein [Acinetobacter puyangensis]SNX46391.1 bifunctional isochorismate lyase / aryl carrier protein [Acinetobacter puyangensis]